MSLIGNGRVSDIGRRDGVHAELVLEHRGGPVHATRDDDGRPALRQILAQAAGELHEAAALGPSGLSGHLKHDGSRARDQGQNVVRSLEDRGEIDLNAINEDEELVQ